MKARCADPTNPRYGAAGIAVCPRWLHGEYGISGVELFAEDYERTARPPLDREARPDAGIFPSELLLDAGSQSPDAPAPATAGS
jgi:hypothetical protein